MPTPTLRYEPAQSYPSGSAMNNNVKSAMPISLTYNSNSDTGYDLNSKENPATWGNSNKAVDPAIVPGKDILARDFTSTLYFKAWDANHCFNDIERIDNPWGFVNNNTTYSTTPYSTIFDTTNPSAITNLAKLGYRSLKFKYPKTYIYSKRDIDVSENKMFTFSFFYKIERNYLIEALKYDKQIYGVWWDNGEIKLFWKPSSNDTKLKRVIHFRYYQLEFDILYDYDTYSGDYFINFMMCMDTDNRLRIFVDGVLYYDQYYTGNFDYTFSGLKIGNYDDIADSTFIMQEGPQIEFDEIAFCTDCLHRESFDVVHRSIHNTHPESEIITKQEEEESSKYIDHKIYGAPGFYTQEKSNIDIVMDQIEIQRHRDYVNPPGYKSDQKYKYRFENNSDDKRAASFFEYWNKEERNNLTATHRQY